MSGLCYVHPRQTVEAEASSRKKDENESMQKVAEQLAYKAAAAQRGLDEMALKHKNLHEAHVAMQAKYHALKQEGGTHDWKAQAKALAERFEKHVNDTRQDMTELAHLRAEMPAVKAKLKELARLQQQTASNKEPAKLKAETPDVQAKLKELAKLKAEMPDVQAKLRELAVLKREMPDVQAKLKELAALKREMPEVQAKLQELAALKREMPEVQAKLKELAALKRELPGVQAKLQEGRAAKLEAATATDSLLHERAAKRNVSEALEACKQMLANTEGVLRVCADLHGKQSSGGELSSALTETTLKMREFLQGLSG